MLIVVVRHDIWARRPAVFLFFKPNILLGTGPAAAVRACWLSATFSKIQEKQKKESVICQFVISDFNEWRRFLNVLMADGDQWM